MAMIATNTTDDGAQPTNEHTNFGFLSLIVAVAAIGGFLFGFDSGVINGTVDGLEAAFNSGDIGTGFNVASMLLGCAAGAFVAGKLADLSGRKTVLMLSAALFIISALGAGISTSSLEFIIYRVFGGLAVGAASVISPAYISEMSPSNIRGRLASVQQVMIITGLTAAFLSNYFLAKWAGASTEIFWWGYEAWRWMFWVQLIPAGLFLLMLFLVPESPRYLVAKGKIDEARSVLTRLFGSEAADITLNNIRNSLVSDHQPRFSDLKDDTTGKVRSIVWVGIGLAVFQQLVGINIVFYYGAVLWQAVGFSENDALLINILSGALSIAAVLVSIAVIDKIGRKPLLTIGSAGMAVTLAAVAFAFSSGSLVNGELKLSDDAGLIALIAANAYVVFFNFSWGPVMWVMLGEMFPNQIRGSGLAVSGFAQWVANFGITMAFPVMLTSIGLAGAYGFYAVCAAISLIFVIMAVKETRGISLEDMTG